MKLDKFSVETYRLFESLNLNLNGKSAVITGDEGVGKSALLKSMAVLLDFLVTVSCSSSDVYKSVKIKGVEALPVGRIYNPTVQMKSSFKFEDSSKEDKKNVLSLPFNVKLGDRSPDDMGVIMPVNGSNFGEEFSDIIERLAEKYYREERPYVCAYYSNDSIIHEQNCRSKDVIERYNDPYYGVKSMVYMDAFPDVESYTYSNVMTYILEYLKSVDRKSFLFFLNVAIKCLYPGYKGMIGVRQENGREEICIEKLGMKYGIDQMSEFEKSNLFMIADLVMRTYISCGCDEHVWQAEGIVLIDNLDRYMHPKYQKGFLTRLQFLYPKIQFIVVTNSPIILSEIPKTFNWIGLNRNVDVKTEAEDGYGFNPLKNTYVFPTVTATYYRPGCYAPDLIMSYLFKTKAESEEIRKILWEYLEYLDSDNDDKTEFLNQKLRELTNDTIEIVNGKLAKYDDKDITMNPEE